MRRGFTLLELLVAISVAGVVVLLVRGVLEATARTASRVGASTSAFERRVVLTAVLDEAIRRASLVLARDPFDPVVRVAGTDNPSTLPAGHLELLTSGGPAPLGAGTDVRLSVFVSPAGLVLMATPLAGGAARVLGRLPEIRGLRILVQGGQDPTWRPEWRQAGSLPRAIAYTLFDSAGPAGTSHLVPLPAGESAP